MPPTAKCSAAIATGGRAVSSLKERELGGIAPRVKPAGYGTGSEIKPRIDERRINAIKSGIQFRSKRRSQAGYNPAAETKSGGI